MSDRQHWDQERIDCGEMTPADTITTEDGRAISLSELDAMHAAMTPGPYTAIGTSVVDWDHEAKTFTMEFIPNRFNEKQTEDARGIVALHNAYPALRDEIRRLRGRVAELESGLVDADNALDACIDVIESVVHEDAAPLVATKMHERIAELTKGSP